jgi:hypothetical protein
VTEPPPPQWFTIEVQRVQSGATVEVGHRSQALSGAVTVGRGADADFRVDDRTVSSRHLRIEPTSSGFRLTNLSERGSTFVHGRRMEPGAAVEIANPAWAQLGRVLLAVAVIPMTVPFEEPMPVPDGIRPAGVPPLLTFRHTPARTELWCRGNAVSLYPSAARVLACLASEPGRIRTHSELDEAADPEAWPRTGGASVPQLLTYARTMFNDALDAGWISDDELVRLVATSSASDVPDCPPTDRAALLRALIQNIRGVGYRLSLPAFEIAFL